MDVLGQAARIVVPFQGMRRPYLLPRPLRPLRRARSPRSLRTPDRTRPDLLRGSGGALGGFRFGITLSSPCQGLALTPSPARPRAMSCTSRRCARAGRPTRRSAMVSVWSIQFKSVQERSPKPPAPRGIPGSLSVWTVGGLPGARRHATSRIRYRRRPAAGRASSAPSGIFAENHTFAEARRDTESDSAASVSRAFDRRRLLRASVADMRLRMTTQSSAGRRAISRFLRHSQTKSL